MIPIVHGLQARYSDRIGFVYLDIDDAATQPFKRELGYRVQPHFFLLDAEGNIVQSWLGRVPEAELEQALQSVLE
jgi:thioredoxin-like negative regulator of GroEL